MPASAHFLLGFASSIFLAALAASAVLWKSDWLNEHGFSPTIVMLAVFILVQQVSRMVFKAVVKVSCPYGCGNTAYPIRGRADRFRCEKCGMDF
jgi:hypothetical protein